MLLPVQPNIQKSVSRKKQYFISKILGNKIVIKKIIYKWYSVIKLLVILYSYQISGSLSPRNGTSSSCGRRNGFQIWRVASNILKKQSRIAEKGWSSSWVQTTLHRKKYDVSKYFTMSRNWTGPVVKSKNRGSWWALVQAVMNPRVP
jgi:hypothetical protein